MVDTNLPYGFFSLKDFQWFSVDTSVDVIKYAFRHGAKVSGAYNGVREFTMTFDAIASDEIERIKLLRLISSIFNPPSIPNSTNGFHDLEFVTPDGNIRTVQVQTKTRPKISDYDNDKWLTCTVDLIAKDSSYIYSKESKTVIDTNTILGYKLPFNLGKKAGYYKDYVDYQGTSDSPVNVKISFGIETKTLTVRDSNGLYTKILDSLGKIFTVKNSTALADQITFPYMYIRSFVEGKLATTLELGEVTLLATEYIWVDSFEEMVYIVSQDGTKRDITGLVSINSSRPLLLSPINGQDQFVVVDYGNLEYKVKVEYSYYDIWD